MSRISHVGFQFEQLAINKSFLSYAAFEAALDFTILGCRIANSLTCADRRVHDLACSAQIPRSDQIHDFATLGGYAFLQILLRVDELS
jgi:hypothetical protein